MSTANAEKPTKRSRAQFIDSASGSRELGQNDQESWKSELAHVPCQEYKVALTPQPAYARATQLIANPYLPSDHRAVGMGSLRRRLCRTQPIEIM